MKTNKEINKITFCALSAGICLVMMYVGYLSGVFDLSAIFVCGLITVVIMIEVKGMYPWLTAAVCTVLSFIMLPSKILAFGYAAVGGLYPILREYAARTGKLVSWILKLAMAEVIIAGYIILVKFVFIAPDATDIRIFPLILLATACFIVYDMALERFKLIYNLKLRDRIKLYLLF